MTVHKDDIGTKFLVTVTDGTAAVDLSTATTKTIKFEKPNGTVINQIAAFETDGSNGQIHYIGQSGDLDATGNWMLQAFVAFGASSFHTEKAGFRVHPHL